MLARVVVRFHHHVWERTTTLASINSLTAFPERSSMDPDDTPSKSASHPGSNIERSKHLSKNWLMFVSCRSDQSLISLLINDSETNYHYRKLTNNLKTRLPNHYDNY